MLEIDISSLDIVLLLLFLLLMQNKYITYNIITLKTLSIPYFNSFIKTRSINIFSFI